MSTDRRWVITFDDILKRLNIEGIVPVANVLVCNIFVSQSRYYVHILTNNLWKGLRFLILPVLHG